jgi:hypothetical protein
MKIINLNYGFLKIIISVDGTASMQTIELIKKKCKNDESELLQKYVAIPSNRPLI